MKGPFIIAALYRFVRIEDPEHLRRDLQQLLEGNQVRGTLLIAREGINGTLAGSRTGIDQVLEGLRLDPRFKDLEHKESTSQEMPFRRTKVRLKKEIVSLGVDEVDPTTEVGTYVEPSDWNELISDPNVILIDTRNDYEVDLGTFRGAENPRTGSFREFPSYIESRFEKGERPRVAMFCTGGIRCEKATSFLRGQGFDDVYHLKGGILKYLEEVDPKESMWEGECFVFDDRVAVDHDLQPGSWDLCHACRRPISEADRSSPEYEPGVQCPHCIRERTDEERERFRERQRQVELAARRGRSHLGDDARAQHLLDRLRKQAEKERQKNAPSVNQE